MLLAISASIGCGDSKPRDRGDDQKMIVFASLPPHAFMLKQIAGERIDVRILIKPGSSPATYAASPKDILDLSQARLFFRAGVPFEEKLMSQITSNCPKLTVIDTRAGIILRKTDAGDAQTCHSDHDHKHQQGAQDPHTWLAPLLFAEQALKAHEALCAADPKGRDDYDKGLHKLNQRLKELDTGLRKLLKPHAGGSILVFHPAYGYFCAAYGLKQLPVEVSGKDPTPGHLVKLIENARARKVEMIFVQPQFSKRTAQTIADQLKATVVTLDPLAYDYFSNIEQMAAQIKRAVK
jgi:zinc transport system substrate-binding protein